MVHQMVTEPKRSEHAALDFAGIRRPLLQWYQKHKRDLPWRRTRDPYRIWISEIMLQQTRVAAVIPYYERFLALFPDAAALA
jgi:A/G-specific adenine glycosylase